MSRLFKDIAFVIGFFVGFSIVIGMNIHSYFYYWGSTCIDCSIRFGFPFSIVETGGFFSHREILWLGLIMSIVVSIIFSFIIGLIFKFVWLKISQNKLN